MFVIKIAIILVDHTVCDLIKTYIFDPHKAFTKYT